MVSELPFSFTRDTGEESPAQKRYHETELILEDNACEAGAILQCMRSYTHKERLYCKIPGSILHFNGLQHGFFLDHTNFAANF